MLTLTNSSGDLIAGGYASYPKLLEYQFAMHTSRELAKEAFRGLLVLTFLHQNIEYVAILVDGTP